jgi:hypothetical protein
MTAKFTKVSPALWRSARFKALGDQGKLLMAYYLTCEHVSSAGAYRIPEGYALTDLGWTASDYRAARLALAAAGLIAFDEETETVYVERWFKHSPPMNPKHALGVMSVIGTIEPDEIREKVEADFSAADEARKQAAITADPKITALSQSMRRVTGYGQ